MDGLSLAASVIAVIQLAGSCLKLSRKFLGPSEFGSSDLTSMTIALYGFNGAVKSFQTLLEVYEDDEARLSSLEYLKPALKQCEKVLHIIKDVVEKSNFIEKHLIGPKFDRKLKTSLKALDGAKELFMLALHADQLTILSAVERYIRNAAEDVRHIHDVVKNNETKIDGLIRDQSEHFRQTGVWHAGITTSLKKLHENGDLAYMEAILDWLTPIDYAAQQSDFISRRQAGTGQWLLDSEKFQAWVETDRQTLFCPGIPGAGKTILTSIVVDYLCTKFKKDPSICIVYLYCNFQRRHEQKPEDLIASLLKQLVLEQSFVSDTVKTLYNQHKDRRTRPSLDEISSTLYSVITTFSRVYIIVDALDECQLSDGCRSRFISTLFNLQTKTTTKLFATSRPIPDIEKEFKGCLSHDILASEEDILRYLDGHKSQLPKFVLTRPELQEQIITGIVKAVKGMFLLAQLYLGSLADKTTAKAIKTALKQFKTRSQGVSEDKKLEVLSLAYEEAMERINGQKEGFRLLANNVLSWITCAKRPLTTIELQHAIAVEDSCSNIDEDNLPEIEDMVSVCAGLVTIDKESNIIRMVHYTTQEYFEQMQIRWFPDAETSIAKTCVTYLSFDAFDTGFCLTEKDFDVRLQENVLYDYAARNWGHHARTASAEVEKLILSFLKNEAKFSACTQAMMASKHYSSRLYNSQQAPRHLTGLHLAAFFGLDEVFNALLKRSHSPDLKDSCGRTPLAWATRNGQEIIVKRLLETKGVKPDLKDNWGQTPLSWAARNGHETVVKLLLTVHSIDPDSKARDGRTPLSWAAANGNEVIVKILLGTNGVEPDSKDIWDQTPLSWAARNGHEAVSKLLLAKGSVNIMSKSTYGRTPLLLAAVKGDEAVVKLLLAIDGVEPDSKDNNGQTPLSWAARKGHQSAVKLLLTMGRADPDSKDNRGQTPLTWAARNGHEEVVKLLLATDCVELDLKDEDGHTPLWWAASQGHEAVVKLLQSRIQPTLPQSTV